MIKRSAITLLASVLTVSAHPVAQVSESQIDAIFTSLKSTNAPGAAVLVVRNGRTVFRRGYGVTDLRSLHKIDEHTNFRLASFTKQFTAACIMLLVRDGKLRYDDHLTDLFPEFPAYGKAITVRNLLNPPISRPPETSGKFPAGAKWEYSNSGYAVLAMIVEKISGKPFGQFLQERIFAPLKMTNTLAYEKGKNDVRNRAYGHTKKSEGWQETDQSPTSAVLGDGGIYSSLADLEKWDRAIRNHTLLTAAEMQPALTPVQPTDGPAKSSEGSVVSYGFGWFLDPHQGHKRMFHDGETIGFRTTIQRFPDDGLTIIVLANRADADPEQLALKVADLYFDRDHKKLAAEKALP